jgi:hypothetical protein
MSYPPGINHERRVALHGTPCVSCGDWVELSEASIDEDDPSLSDAIFDRDAPVNDSRENMQDRIRGLGEEVRVANGMVDMRDARIRELVGELRVANAKLAENQEFIQRILDALKNSNEVNLHLQGQLAGRDTFPRPRKRQRRSPSPPISISDDDSPPSLPPSAPGPAGPSRIQGEVDGRDRGNAPPVSLIVSPSTNPPPLYSSYLPFSDCFNSPTRRCDHHKGSPVAGRPHVWQAVGRR